MAEAAFTELRFRRSFDVVRCLGRSQMSATAELTKQCRPGTAVLDLCESDGNYNNSTINTTKNSHQLMTIKMKCSDPGTFTSRLEHYELQQYDAELRLTKSAN